MAPSDGSIDSYGHLLVNFIFMYLVNEYILGKYWKQRICSNIFDICCQGVDPEWLPTGCNWRSSFVKKLQTKEIWKMVFLFYYIKRNFCFKVYFTTFHAKSDSLPLWELLRMQSYKIYFKAECESSFAWKSCAPKQEGRWGESRFAWKVVKYTLKQKISVLYIGSTN